MTKTTKSTRRRYHIRGVCRLSLLLLLVAGCMVPSDDAGDPPAVDPRAEAFTDPAYREAAAALELNRPWRAEALLAPALEDSARRTQWVVLLAAEAAGATNRWDRVDSLLSDTTFADSRAAANARLLLARGALERGNPATALGHSRALLEAGADRDAAARAWVFAARSRERLGERDSARAGYIEAAETLLPIADWLMLRAAALSRDSSVRASEYRRLRTPAARRHAKYIEAQILERSGRASAAIALYEDAGEPVHAMRLRASTARGLAERNRSRQEIVAFIRTHTGTQSARVGVQMLDEGRYKLTADEEVVVARSAAVHGPLSRARTGLARAFAVRPPTPEERLFQISVLVESGPASRAQAERLLAQIRKPSPIAGIAAYERGKLLLRRGRKASARDLLRATARLYPDDTVAAAGALFVLAEMATDELRDAAARDAYLALARRYPTSERAPRARFDAAILALGARSYRAAAAELDTLAELHPASVEASAARYWGGRARLALRDTAAAHDAWRVLLATDSTSFYASQAARRLGTMPWAPPASPDTFAVFPDVNASVERADLLESLGMDSEARLELSAMAASAESSVERVLAIANVFRNRGHMRTAMDLGRRAVALGATDARAWRLVYPIGEADLVGSEAMDRKVDPALVAALIRQESSFNPLATSPVGARGLMQVMPRVGRALARAEKISPWETEMLYDPAVNVRLGVIHLGSFTRHYRHPALALAAYNAGGSRVARWSKRPGARDPELFIERIRFTETRGYVRTVLRSRDMYAALYGWEPRSEAN